MAERRQWEPQQGEHAKAFAAPALRHARALAKSSPRAAVRCDA
jgi:hypothetical protein